MSKDQNRQAENDFRQRAQQGRSNIASEFWHFLMHNKKWWLLPIIIVILLLGALVVLGGSGAAPFIYTLF
jgi:hypothetical protein